MEQDHDTSPMIEAVHDANELAFDVSERLHQRAAQDSRVVFLDPREVQLNAANTRDLDANPAAIKALAASIHLHGQPLAASIHLHGQQVACIGRRLEDRRIELVAGKPPVAGCPAALRHRRRHRLDG